MIEDGGIFNVREKVVEILRHERNEEKIKGSQSAVRQKYYARIKIYDGGNKMGRQYGYCRISTGRQNIMRQERNIKAAFPDAVIVREIYTGTKFQGRKELERLLGKVRPQDTIIFDSVSRMSRDAEEGFRLYEELFHRDVSLVFLKEPHINTETYKRAMMNQVTLTGDKVDLILKGVNCYLMELAKEQIRLAFEQAEKEVADLHQRTREGIETARLNGKQIGQPKGAIYETKKARKAKEIIRKHNKSFGGSLTDAETMRQAGVSRKSFYKYKKEVRENTLPEIADCISKKCIL